MREFEDYTQQEYFNNPEENMFYQLGIASSLASLRGAFRQLHGIEGLGETHQKVVVNELDLVMTFVDRYNYFTQKLSCYSKDRTIILLGLSAGFSLTTDLLLKGNSRF